MVADLGDIVAALGGELVGDASIGIERLGPLEGATPGTLSFLANPRFEPQLAASDASCVIVSPKLRDAAAARGAVIVTSEPHLYFARLTQWWVARTRPRAPVGVHPAA